jgi:hypothetical protein
LKNLLVAGTQPASLQRPRGAQPIQGVAQRLDIGSHGIAQLALGPGRGEEHVVGWTTLDENSEVLRTTLPENGPTLIDNSPKTSVPAHNNEK